MTLGEIAHEVGGALHGPADLMIVGPGAPENSEPGVIVFAISEKYLSIAEASNAAAVLLPRHLSSNVKPYIQVDNPKLAFNALLRSAAKPLPLGPGVHPTAVIDPSATVSSHANVGAYAVIEKGARIEAGCRVYPFAYVGEDCELGENCVLYPHVVLYQGVKLGQGTIVHAGAILGADGFGYFWDGQRQQKVPHIGRVDIGADCEIGALTAVDRATVGETSIGSDTKIDNLVQIAHNVQIGQHSVIAAQSGISGSATLGDRATLAGQVGVGDHVKIVSDVALAARTAAIQDIDFPGQYIGTPAQPIRTGKRAMMLISKLPEILERIRRLEKKTGE